MSIIETRLESTNKTPMLFGLPQILDVKSKLEACNSIGDVIVMLKGNSSLISKSFVLSGVAFDDCVKTISALKAQLYCNEDNVSLKQN